jgi:hypothetical protein
VHTLESILQTVLPDANLTELIVDTPSSSREQNLRSTTSGANEAAPLFKNSISQPRQKAKVSINLKTRGSLQVDDEGKHNYHNHFAGFTFLQRMWEQYSRILSWRTEKTDPSLPLTITHVFSFSHPALKRRRGLTSRDSETLPSREIAVHLARVCLENACCTLKFIHTPSFDRILGRLYELDPEDYSDADQKSLALVFAVLAIGVVFSKDDAGKIDSNRIRIEGYDTFKNCSDTTYIT